MLEKNQLVNTNFGLAKPNPQLGDLKPIFLSFLANLNKSTAKSYGASIKHFSEFLAETQSDINALSDLKRHHLIFYSTYLKEKGYANKTILKKLSAISSLCKFLANEGIIDKDVVYGVKRPKTQNKTETADLSDQDVKKIFASLDEDNFYYYSHRAILAVGFYTGLRSSEIRHLKIENFGKVDGHHVLKTLIKGGKTHEIPLNPFVVRCLEQHIERLKELKFNINGDHYLFPPLKTKENKAMRPQAIIQIFQGKLKKAGIEKSHLRRYSPHSMRATLAGHLLNTVEAPLEEVQKLLGHSSPTTTQRYNKRDKSHDKSPVYKIEY